MGGGRAVPSTSLAAAGRHAAVQVVDKRAVYRIVRSMLGGEKMNSYTEEVRVQLLQMATLLIEHMYRELMEYRKELIKFAWHHLKSEDTTSKHWAYVNVCRFIEVYETPPKIILQVYVALLRTHQTESRGLVRKALDILAPALSRRLPQSELVRAIKWTKKILFEEGHSLSQLAHIWQVVVHNERIFFPHRAQFVPQMVNSLSRLGLPPSCPLENRELAVDLAALITYWETYRRTARAARHQRDLVRQKRARVAAAASSSAVGGAAGEAKEAAAATSAAAVQEKEQKAASSAKKGSASGSKKKAETPTAGSKPTSSGESDAKESKPSKGTTGSSSSATTSSSRSSSRYDDGFAPNDAMVEMVANFVLREALVTADTSETRALSKRCIQLFLTILQVWPRAALKFAYFQKLTPAVASSRSSSQAAQAAHQARPPSTLLSAVRTALLCLWYCCVAVL